MEPRILLSICIICTLSPLYHLKALCTVHTHTQPITRPRSLIRKCLQLPVESIVTLGQIQEVIVVICICFVFRVEQHSVQRQVPYAWHVEYSFQLKVLQSQDFQNCPMIWLQKEFIINSSTSSSLSSIKYYISWF